MPRLIAPALLLAAGLLLQGCVSTVVGATGSVIGAGVEVTGKTVGAAKDVVFIHGADRETR